MNLTEMEMDALAELFNIGLHRAAASLSDLTGQRIVVDLPRLWVSPMSDLKGRLVDMLDNELATVHQIFAGPVGGDAVLMLEYDKAVLLASLMTNGDVALDGRLDQSAREVLSEVGNVVLSACLSAFSNVMEVSVSFSVPRMHVESLDGLLRSVVGERGETRYGLIAATQFRLSQLAVGGYLIVVLGVNSLAKISEALAAREM